MVAIDNAISRNSESGVVYVSANPRLDPRYFFGVSTPRRINALGANVVIAELMRKIKDEII